MVNPLVQNNQFGNIFSKEKTKLKKKNLLIDIPKNALYNTENTETLMPKDRDMIKQLWNSN